jgi:proline iminopeptidase
MLFPDAWQRFCAPIPQAERGDMIAAYHKRLTHPERRVQAEAAAAWSQWEGDTISIRGPEARPSKFNEIDFAIAFARIECHFFANHGFFPEEGWILKNAAKLKAIPGWIVQGRFDVVTPMEAAWKLKGAWPEARFEVVWDAGHASTEPGIVDALVRATDQALSV